MGIQKEGQVALTTLQRANFLMRSGQWEQAAITYLSALKAQASLRSLVTVNLTLLLRKAPRASIAKEVLDQMASILPNINVGYTRNATPADRYTTSSIEVPGVEPTDLARALTNGLGVEQVYVVNLARRPDRYVRALREMTKHGLRVKRIDGVDSLTSDEANRAFERFLARPIGERLKSSEHVSDAKMRVYKKKVSVGAFGYILSQAKVLRDAITEGYKRILVLDDDVFFHRAAACRLEEIGRCLPADLKVLLLGASEYEDRSSNAFRDSRIFDHPDLYRPIVGKTCGSFAMVYDRSVFEELIDAIDEANGTFDNVILGSVYLRNLRRCVVVDPAVCIPDVRDSDIRSTRAQVAHSAQMNWEFDRYGEYTKPLDLTVLVSSLGSLRHIESMQHEIGSRIFLNVFYVSEDGLRPVIPGHRFIPHDNEALAIRAANQTDLRQLIADLRVPRSDAVLLWPQGRLFTEDAAMQLFSRVMNVPNSTGSREGAIEGIPFCLDAGVAPVRGRHSIIIPSYREVEFVWPTVKSALSQDAQDVEVILVNDNPANQQFSSRLRSLAVTWEKDSGAEGLADRLRVIDHRQNRHAAAARNTGLLCASGEFISFLDDDDYYEPNRLSGIESELQGAGEDVGAIYCGYSGNWNGERNMERFPEGDLGEHILALRYSKHYMCTNTITFRRASLQRIGGFNESFVRHQDVELMARYFDQFNISSVPKFLVKNRPNPVPETFVADIPRLCRLKHHFLSDMRVNVTERGRAFVTEVIDAHTKDITKRDKQMAASMTEIIRTFLSSALRESQ